jgi:hypothetical protein
MAYGFAPAVANTMLDTDFANPFVKLHVGDPGASGATNPSAGDATRKQATMAAASAGSKAMTGTAGPWTHGSAAGTGSESITGISLHTLASGGVFKGSSALGSPQTWVGTNTFTLTGLTVSFSPLAS